MDAAEYAISKHVRNNLVVREVDEIRQRQLWRWVFIVFVLVAAAVITAWQHLDLLRYGYRLEALQRERADEEEITRRLRLEIETLRSPERIEQYATERLHMVEPRRDEVVVIERVVPAEPPPSSVVASR